MVAEARKPKPRELSREEGRAIVDQQARERLGMSGDEFMRKWDAGYFAADPDRRDVMHVATLLDLAR